MVFVLCIFHRPSDPSPRLHIASALPSKQLQLLPSPALPVVRTKHPDPSGAPFSAPQLKQDEQASLWKAFSEARREVIPLNDHESSLPFNQGVRLFAQNPGQKLTARFLDDGVRIQSGRANSDWQATFTATNLPPVTSITTQGSRVEYQRGPVIEWYDNKPEGIEQGFIVIQPQGQEGELRVEVAAKGLSIQPSTPSTFQLADAQGTARLSYSKLSAWDAIGKCLPARMETASNGIALVVDDAGARYPITIDPLIGSLEQKLGPSVTGEGAPSDKLGYSVFINGETALVGSRTDSTVSGTNSGSVYVFTRLGTIWAKQTKLIASDLGNSNYFGHSLSMSGESALIGAIGQDIGKGCVYVFTRTGITWTQQAKLTAYDAENSDQFGYSVSLSGDTALVGANYGNTSTVINAGSAYVFTRSGTSWSFQAKLTASDAAADDYFGSSVSLYGDTALVGATYDDTITGSDTGSAYVYTRSANIWTQQAKLIPSDSAPSDNFGISVSLNGDTALVGAQFGDTTTEINKGSAYVFTRSGSDWTQQTELAPTDVSGVNFLGYSVSLFGDTALVGAHYSNVAAQTGAGCAFVFTRTGSNWTQQALLVASDVAANDHFGNSISLNGDTALIGASFDDTVAGEDAGSAYVFTRSGTTWTQQAQLTANDGSSWDQFGASVSLDGNTALVGANLDTTAAGVKAGSAYVFTRSGTIWTLQAKLNPTDAAAQDYFGISVALSGDTALVGSFLDNTTAGSDAGSAYVFTRSGTTWTQQAILSASDSQSGDHFGISVSLNGDTALVGSDYGDTLGKIDSGSAYVFIRSGTSWSQQAKLIATDGTSSDNLGHSVSLDLDTAIVGAYHDATAAGSNAGSAYIFRRSGTTWSQEGKLTASDGASENLFGMTVSVSGNTALVGAPYNSMPSRFQAGAAYIFTRSGSTWSQQSKITTADGKGGSRFGISVYLSGETALVGAHHDAAFIGSAFVFTRLANSWSEQTKLSTATGQMTDEYCTSVCLSGNTVLLGSYADTGTSYSGEPIQGQGSIRLFHLINSPITGADSDGDGVSDTWESTHSFDPNRTNDFVTLDSDADGDHDLLEIYQGTGRFVPGDHHGLSNTIAVRDTNHHELITHYRRSTTQTAVYGALKWSTDLVNWYAPGVDMNGIRINITESSVETGSGYEVLEATAAVTLGSPDRLFLKLELVPME